MTIHRQSRRADSTVSLRGVGGDGASPTGPVPILFFDAPCGWCRGWTGWLARRTPRLLLAPLQGETARRCLSFPPDAPHQTSPTDTLVLFVPGPAGPRITTHARALLGAMALAGVGGAAGRVLWVALARLPRGVLDPPYRLLARHRQRLTALAPACPLPDTADDRMLP